MAKALRRHNGRRADRMRPIAITPGFVRAADGSCLIEVGGTRVICTASLTPGVPQWMSGRGRGWVTAEYGMLPASTGRRKPRAIGKPDSRGVEIQRLIGRVLRTVVRMDRLGENTVALDCDVLEADGGTRTAAITGAQVALSLLVAQAVVDGRLARGVLASQVAAVSVGIVDGQARLDLNYDEDSRAEVDMNVAMHRDGRLVEVQATAEGASFSRAQMNRMLAWAETGIRKLLALQRRAIREGLQ